MERSGSASLGEMYLSWNPKDGEEPDVQTRGRGGVRQSTRRVQRPGGGTSLAPSGNEKTEMAEASRA